MSFIEAPHFSSQINDHLSDDEYLGLQLFLERRPDAGDILSGSGGIRKRRWAIRGGKGKWGGVKLFYYWNNPDDEIWMLSIFSNKEQATIPDPLLQKIAKEINMSDRDIGLEVLEGLQEIKAFKKEGVGNLRTHTLSQPASSREIRERLGLSQSAFATLMEVSLRTIQDWEQGRREPSGPARSLLRIADQRPDVFLMLA